MNAINKLIIAVTIGFTINAATQAQGRPGGKPPFAPDGPPPFVKELPARFAILSAADANADKLLDETELTELANAIADGTLAKPEWLPNPPENVVIPAAAVAQNLAKFYEAYAPFDANNNGTLEDNEKTTIREAIMAGELKPPFLLIRGDKGRPSKASRRGQRPNRSR
ncbi:hypothetical protein OAH36_03795 [Verrucomicrobia bacterium]|mgnify:CR=1 FL=1|jgi:hypothetical protein|nr:hypothetical protein [bacterium]MDB4798702.1 hypothetical protein [Verrucomicrobiota bacterium]